MEDSSKHKLQEQEIAYIRRDMDRIEKKIDNVDTSLTRGLEAVTAQLTVMSQSFIRGPEFDKQIIRLEKLIDEKADRDRFDIVEDTQRKTMWAVVAGVIVAGLGALFTLSQ